MMKKHLANIITSLRIAGTLALLPVDAFSKLFCGIYTFCGITDVLDGFIARKTKSASDFGARLDSIADLCFYAVMIIKIFPELWACLPRWVWLIVLTAAAVRICAYITAAIKYRRFASLHTYLNKITGVIIFAIPYFVYVPNGLDGICILASATALIASAEELAIHIIRKQYAPIKSILNVQGI